MYDGWVKLSSAQGHMQIESMWSYQQKTTVQSRKGQTLPVKSIKSHLGCLWFCFWMHLWFCWWSPRTFGYVCFCLYEENHKGQPRDCVGYQGSDWFRTAPSLKTEWRDFRLNYEVKQNCKWDDLPPYIEYACPTKVESLRHFLIFYLYNQNTNTNQQRLARFPLMDFIASCLNP